MRWQMGFSGVVLFVGIVLRADRDAAADAFGLLTVTNTNELAVVDVENGCSATVIGVTQDAVSPFTVRRIRGLAYDETNDVLYGMTREGDLVTVDRQTGATAHVLQIPCGTPSNEFWSDLAFDGPDTLYTANASDSHDLAKITLVPTPSATCIGSTVFEGTVPIQILGLAIYPPAAPLPPPTFNGVHPNTTDLYGANRSNNNIVVVAKTNGAVTFPMGNHTMDVGNVQGMTFHPTTGVLYTIHDVFSQSNNAALATYDFTTETATELCELPFGIVETVGGGNDTYGWGGLTFGPCSSGIEVLGRRLLLKEGSGEIAQFKAVDPNVTYVPGAPSGAGATVTVFEVANPTNAAVWDVPPGLSAISPGWVTDGPARARYRNFSAPSGPTGTRKSLLRAGKRVVHFALSFGDSAQVTLSSALENMGVIYETEGSTLCAEFTNPLAEGSRYISSNGVPPGSFSFPCPCGE